ncbi:peptide chain release factor N(5)-glutamine methyltransferase [Magnetospirillum aberrantis]|uniref:Release factor glutamine methyltransferase n=1 Tax=Magnetospirillum aberrantis SpK TaxID=908842 RepID=A0A7C9V1A0_9PROT|nr:peptide chain release factor N(5)-glutamine methyltransferase [Magnetospirillum aberrantis SpK]
METIGAAARALAQRFVAAGIDTARLDARLLVAEVAGIAPDRVALAPDTPLTSEQATRLEHLAVRRQRREPISHILGRRGFWTLELKVTADTLDPRGDTETLVEAVLARVADRSAPLRVMDFGTGTGAILLALLSELPNASGVAVDKSPAALAVARENAENHGLAGRVDFVLSDWAAAVEGSADVVVSNPPYIPDSDIDRLEPEVATYEPRLALAGGPDGLECYRVLVPQMAALAVPGGVVAVEVGAGQGSDVAALFRQAGLTVVALPRDLAGVERCVVATK